jgi:hypothetical protein
MDAAPVYEPLSGFSRYDLYLQWLKDKMGGLADSCFLPRLDPRETSVAVLTRRAAVTTHGRHLKSKHAYSALPLL